MDILFFVSLFIVGLISAIVSFIPEKKLKKGIKAILFIMVLACLVFDSCYGLREKKIANYKDRQDDFFQNESLKQQHELSKNIKEMKEKEDKGLFTDKDYGRYIALHLENINLSLRRLNSRNMRERVTAYYEEVNKIPAYFNPQEWKESEKFIYDSIIDEINGDFNSRNMFDSGLRTKALEIFNKERNRLIQAKEKELVK